MRDNFVYWEGLVQMPINGNFTMKIVLFNFGGEGGGRNPYPFRSAHKYKIKSNRNILKIQDSGPVTREAMHTYKQCDQEETQFLESFSVVL